MKWEKKDFLLYAVTGGRRPGNITVYEQAEAALKGGATLLQFREKQQETACILEEARKIKELCAKYKVPFIINDSVEIAQAVDADGVHLGPDDMHPAQARRILGREKLIGVSARTLERALEAERCGADYLGTGAVFATGTKADAKEISHRTLWEICRAVSVPVVAIGGINETNAMKLAGSGVSGIAVVSALFAQPDAEKIEAAARRLRRLAEDIVQKENDR